MEVAMQEHWPGRGCRQVAGGRQGRVEQVGFERASQLVIPAGDEGQPVPACGQVDRDSRESQAVFRCTACGFACNADVNAARNIAAGHAVTARGGDGVARPVNREPHLLLPSA